MAEQVVAAGGLLVLGTSLQEGERIELQLRGRAGRQGDPGTTQLMFDVGDPLIANFGMQTFQQLAGSLLSSGQLLPYQESVVVDLLHREVQKSMENQWQMARLETKRYDEVLEVYRRNLYSLRRLILTGDSQQRNRVGFKTQLALAAHAKLFGTPAAAAYSSSHTSTSSSSSSEPLQLPEHWSLPEGLLAMQRPPVKGRHAAKVQVLRNYLGTSLIHAYELRHLTLRRLLVSSSAGAAGSSSGMLDLDAELYLQAYCRSVMLEWVDALWSCFLEDVDKLRHAVGLKAYSSQQPLEEFRLEANRAFLVLLDSYRDAVVARLMVPDLNFSLLLDQQLDSLGEGDLPGSMQQPGTAAGVNGAVNGRGAGSNGRQPQGGDMLQPAGAANQRRMA
ncbi:hypothetical protein OEZ85_000643 [Tetradesmus obliquus]|nr:hypothetical protein OEZ85_000643 [Tetradesmus obliquus]